MRDDRTLVVLDGSLLAGLPAELSVVASLHDVGHARLSEKRSTSGEAGLQQVTTLAEETIRARTFDSVVCQSKDRCTACARETPRVVRTSEATGS
jgi:predicted HD phosphohydrolase